MKYRSFDIVVFPGTTEEGYYYKIFGYGHPKTPNKIRCRRAMMGFASELEAIQKAKDVIDLKIYEGKWTEMKS